MEIELFKSQDTIIKERKYRIRAHIRNEAEKRALTHIISSTETISVQDHSITVDHFRRKKDILQGQKAHNNKAAKQLAIEAAKRAANKQSNGIIVSLDSQAAKKLKYAKRAEQRQAAILKHCVKVLINQ
jgi:hypothetical protein